MYVYWNVYKVGRKVMEGCCKTLKPVVLELGGKDPFVVCDDVDLDRLMPFIMKGSFFNCGQNCIGVERVYVYEKVSPYHRDFPVAALFSLWFARFGTWFRLLYRILY